MSRIAFLSMDSLDGFVAYDSLVIDRLVARGITADVISWRNRSVQWNQFDMVVVRSPWDYQQAADEFLVVLESIESSTARLWNPLDVIQWNIRKTYLQAMHDQGLQIVPTRFITDPTEMQLRQVFAVFETREVVVKPVVGANADGTFRLRADCSSVELQQIQAFHAGQTVLIQPFIESVVNHGELSLIFFDGQYSHSILKTPKRGDFRVQEEHGGFICAHQPDQFVIDFAQRCLAAAPEKTLYGRVDLVELKNGQPAVMELELIEPSLYLSYDEDSADRFADAIERFLV